MKKLVRIRRLLDDAEEKGIDPDSIVVNPDKVQTVEPPEEDED